MYQYQLRIFRLCFLIFYLFIMHSLEGYRAAIGTFNLRLGHRFSQTKMPISEKQLVNQFVFKLLMEVLFIYFVYLNLYYRLVNFFKLTIVGVESNPGPRAYDIKSDPRGTSNMESLLECSFNYYLFSY